MADKNILAGMTTEQADADIAAREAKVEQLEATLAAARDNLEAAHVEREQLEDLAPGGEGTAAQAGGAEASGKVGG